MENSSKQASGATSHSYSEVLQDLAVRLAYHQQECHSIKSAMEYLTSCQPAAEHEVSESQANGSHREFAGLSVIDATACFLAKSGKPQPVPTIMKALLEGGFQTKSKKFSAIVWPALSRHVQRTKGTPRSVITKFDSGFGLTKWKEEGVML
jgi:hypothetical protein